MQFQHGQKQVTRPITDHPPLIQNTVWGAVATLNILHPGSAIAPPAQIDGVRALPGNGKVQMEAMAKYILAMFQQGVGILALQEVPAPHTPNLGFLIVELNRLVGTSGLIDANALNAQWLKTGTHAFGTTVLYNPSRFTLTQAATPALNNRAAEYEFTDTATNTRLPMANIHGDFVQQQATTQYINAFNGICLGDANLSNFVPSNNPLAIQSAEKPILVVEGQARYVNTFDIFQDTYSKQANPHFEPNTTAIHQAPVTITPPQFQPKVFQVPPHDAVEILTGFSQYLANAGKASLVNLKGRIDGVMLTTPGPGAHITISNEEVQDAFLAYTDLLQAY